jgi:hypothetical protein
MRLPLAPRAAQRSEFTTQGAMPPPTGSAMAGAFPPVRSSDLDWTAGRPKSTLGRINPPPAGFSRRNGVHLKRLSMSPNGVISAPQTAFQPFIPQEPKGCPVVPFQAVIAGGAPPPPPPPTTLPELSEVPQPRIVPSPAKVAIHFEEHFENGWDNWVGGVNDWKVDVAGVRTGSMALYMPTLDLADYDLEFFARIDTKTLNWVIRASGEDQHLRCTLTAVEGNQVEFSRTLVIGGAAENPVVAAMRVPGKKRATLTVRTLVSGNNFSVTVDGNEVDTWTEKRLPSGGVGFMGAADDRARLYWVKVSSSQSTGKE